VSDARFVDLDAQPREGRRVLHLTGADVVRFLQGTLSNDVAELGPGQGVPVTLLTPKGKIISDGIAFCRAAAPPAEGIGLAVPAEIAEDVAARLDRHIIMDDVNVQLEPDTRVGFTFGGEAPVAAGGARVLKTRHPAPGWLVVGEPDAVAQTVAGRDRVDAEAWASYRIETASPAWGHELALDVFPPEVGFVHAVSYDKGCFMGQEPLARIHARGQVNRVLVQVEAIEGGGQFELPLDLANDDRDDAGRLTTFAGGRGLAVVRRKALSIPEGAAAAMLRAENLAFAIRSAPLGDDPGLGGKKPSRATVKLGGR